MSLTVSVYGSGLKSCSSTIPAARCPHQTGDFTRCQAFIDRRHSRLPGTPERPWRRLRSVGITPERTSSVVTGNGDGWRGTARVPGGVVDVQTVPAVVPGMWRDTDLSTVHSETDEGALRVTSAFPRRPPPYGPPTPEEIAQARYDYQHHIPSWVAYHVCLAEGCGYWPCRRYRRAVFVLDRAALIDIDGSLR